MLGNPPRVKSRVQQRLRRPFANRRAARTVSDVADGASGVQLSHVRSPGAISSPDLTSRSAIHAVSSYPMTSRPRTANRHLLARLISGPTTVLTSVNLDRAIDPGSSSGLASSPADLPIWAAQLRAPLSGVTLRRCAPAVRGRTAAVNRRHPISLTVQS